MNLSTKCNFYKKGINDLSTNLYHLYADLSHEYCLGRFPEDQYRWIISEIEDLNDLLFDLLSL